MTASPPFDTGPPAEGRYPPLLSLPPRSVRLMPSRDTMSPIGCPSPPWPTWPVTRLWTPSWRVSTCLTPVIFVLSRVSAQTC